MENCYARIKELEKERLMAAAGALLKIQQTCGEAIAKIHQLDGAISILEQLQQSEQPKD